MVDINMMEGGGRGEGQNKDKGPVPCCSSTPASSIMNSSTAATPTTPHGVTKPPGSVTPRPDLETIFKTRGPHGFRPQGEHESLEDYKWALFRAFLGKLFTMDEKQKKIYAEKEILDQPGLIEKKVNEYYESEKKVKLWKKEAGERRKVVVVERLPDSVLKKYGGSLGVAVPPKPEGMDLEITDDEEEEAGGDYEGTGGHNDDGHADDEDASVPVLVPVRLPHGRVTRRNLPPVVPSGMNPRVVLKKLKIRPNARTASLTALARIVETRAKKLL